MSIFRLEGDDYKPDIFFDPYNQLLKISGNSYLEDASALYKQLSEKIIEHTSDIQNGIKCEFSFKYINTSSQKMLYEIICKLAEVVNEISDIKAVWFHAKGDIDMMELGVEISNMFKIDMQIKQR